MLKIKVLADVVSGEGPSSGSKTAVFSLLSSPEERARETVSSKGL